MTGPVDPVTRRRLLASLGAGATGLVAIGGVAPSTAGAVPAGPSGEVAADTPATTSYRMLGYADWMVRNPATANFAYLGSGRFTATPPGQAELAAPIDVPNGVRLVEVEVTGNNNSKSGQVGVSVFSYGAGGPTTLGSATVAADAGDFTAEVKLNTTVDTAARSYVVVVNLPDSANQSLLQARVGYRGAGQVSLISQARLVDTRSGGGRISAGGQIETRTYSLASLVPERAQAALVNLTVTQTQGDGFLALFPGDVSWPGTSSINWWATGQTLANTTVVALSPTREIKVRGGGITHFIIDVLGFVA